MDGRDQLNKEIREIRQNPPTNPLILTLLEGVDAKQANVAELKARLNIKNDDLKKVSSRKRTFSTKFAKVQSCPTCFQPVSDEHKSTHIAEEELLRQSLTQDTSSLTSQISTLQREIQSTKDQISALQIQDTEQFDNRLNPLISSVQAMTTTLEEFDKKYHYIQGQITAYTSQLSTVQADTKRHEKLRVKSATIEQLRADIGQLRQPIYENKTCEIYKEVTDHFQKGIRRFVTSKLIEVLQFKVRSWADVLFSKPKGGSKTYIFPIIEESENHSIVIKIGWIDNRVTKLASLSTAEYVRIHLSFFLGLSEMLLKNRMVYTNLLVFDEPLSGMDTESIVLLLQGLKDLSMASLKSIFLAEVAHSRHIRFNWQQIIAITRTGERKII